MKVILISGKSASGKDTFANILFKKLTEKNHKVLIAHFADLVKFYAKQYYKIKAQVDYCTHPQHQSTFLSSRHARPDVAKRLLVFFVNKNPWAFLRSIYDEV